MIQVYSSPALDGHPVLLMPRAFTLVCRAIPVNNGTGVLGKKRKSRPKAAFANRVEPITCWRQQQRRRQQPKQQHRPWQRPKQQRW